MNMEIIKTYKVLLVLALVVIVAVFFFFSRMYHNDVKALTDFLASYDKFDKVMSDFSIPVFASNLDFNKTDDLESKADEALIELNTKASALKLSFLIKNDVDLMSTALEIADFSGKDLDNLKAYKRAVQSKNADLDGLAKEYRDFTSKRKTAYARFQGLGPDSKD